MDVYPFFPGERYRNSDPEIPPVWIIPLMRAIDTVTWRTPSKKPVGIVKKNTKGLIVLDLLKVFLLLCTMANRHQTTICEILFYLFKHFKQIQVIGCWDGYRIHQEHRRKILPHHTACTLLKLCDLQTFVPCDTSSPSKNSRRKDLC